MKYDKILEDIFGQKVKLRILRYLVSNPEGGSARSIAVASDVNHWQCSKTLKALQSSGILTLKISGRNHNYALNKDAYLVKDIIEPLFIKEKEYLGALLKGSNALSSKCVESVSVFGSTARGDSRKESDVDLFVVVKDSKEKVSAQFDNEKQALSNRFGLKTSPYYVTEKELKNRFTQKDPLIKEVVRDYITIKGKTIGELLTK
jgi:predicted nucleotidyltransferase